MKLTDEARSILVFAAYHQLLSGDPVTEVVLDDGAGHQASPKGKEELDHAGLIILKDNRAEFTAEGQRALGEILASIRRATGG